MIRKSLLPPEEEIHPFPSMSHQKLRKAVSDLSIEINTIDKNLETAIAEIEQVVEQIECECCGIKEDCTQLYIKQIKTCFSGKWVCGLCSEAVKERLVRVGPITAMEEALSSHRSWCQEFNSTTRLNPKLSLAFTLKKIARTKSESRNTTHSDHSCTKSSSSGIVRSTSCLPTFDLN